MAGYERSLEGREDGTYGVAQTESSTSAQFGCFSRIPSRGSFSVSEDLPRSCATG